MSNWLYLRCEDHDPPLLSDYVGQHLYDLPDIRDYITHRDAYVALAESDDYPAFASHYTRHAYTFLVAHPRCRIGIVDEYGREHPTQEDTP